MNKELAMRIRLSDMLNHFKTLPNKFDLQVSNAKLDVGKLYVEGFMKSFDDEGFIGSGKKWPRRKRNYTHPIMQETGSLKRSISFELIPSETIRIYTREHELNKDVKNGRKSSYAKFHNDQTGTWGNNVQRQFIGDSELLERQAIERLNMIFDRLGI